MIQTKNNKAQLRMGESILVILIFFIILSLGAIFYVRVGIEKASQDKQEFKSIDAIKLAQQIAKLPELTCTKEGIEDFNCIDEFKYKAFSKLFDDITMPSYAKYYTTLFPNIQASVVKIYLTSDAPGTPILDTTLKKEDASGIQKPVAKSGQKFFIPVTIYNSIEETTSFGYIELGVYQ